MAEVRKPSDTLRDAISLISCGCCTEHARKVIAELQELEKFVRQPAAELRKAAMKLDPIKH